MTVNNCRPTEIAERVHERIHILRPAVIIEGHGTTQIVTVQKAQISNCVAGLSDRIGGASQNNGHNPRYPEIPQLSKLPHISSFPPVTSWCRDDWPSTSGATRLSEN